MANTPEPGQSPADAGTHRVRTSAGRDDALLPDVPGDEFDLIESRSDDWFRDERPPHHD
jgi:hypothetical protein